MTDMTASDQTPDGNPVGAEPAVQPLRDGDTSIEPDPTLDPAQAEWDRTTSLDEGRADEFDGPTATGDDPAHIPTEEDQIPAEDLPRRSVQPETQGVEPTLAELGEEGQGDLAPEDL
jgi:hypothetical protein